VAGWRGPPVPSEEHKGLPTGRFADTNRRAVIKVVLEESLNSVGDVIVESAGENGQVVLRHLRDYRERSEAMLSSVQKQ